MARPKKMLGVKPGKENLLIKRQANNPGTITEAMQGIKKGGAYSGFLGDGNIVRKPEYAPTETLSSDEAKRKQVIQKFLLAIVEPNQLSVKSTPEADKRSFANKLKKSLLKEIERMLPEQYRTQPTDVLEQIASNSSVVSEDEKAEIQDLYKEVSP